MERIWMGRADEPEFLRDNVQDVLALVLLGSVGLLSLGLTGITIRATRWFLDLVGLTDVPGSFLLTTVIGFALALLTDVVVFLWLLRVVPSTSHPVRLLMAGALFGAAGLEGMKLLGSLYLSLISGSVTASAFGGAVGILVWINIVFRFAFFTAAWTATLGSIQALTSPDPLPAPARQTRRTPAPDGAPARALALARARVGFLRARLLPGRRQRP
jgi:membrane protein